MKLKFGKGNAKLDKTIYTFSLPAGQTCPGAMDCKSQVIVINGSRKIKDGPNTKFRCFAASSEVLYPVVYEARQYNIHHIKANRGILNKARLIENSLPPKATHIRLHVAGDFYCQSYFDAWLLVAKNNKDVVFYAYTKSIPYWLKRKRIISDNFVLTASLGSKFDDMIKYNELRSAKVVFSEAEAANLGLEIDHDDSHAIRNGPSFALLLHGVQPAGTEAAKAKVALKGKGSYSTKKVGNATK